MNLHVIVAAEALLRPQSADFHTLVDRLCSRPVALVDSGWLVTAKNNFFHSPLLATTDIKRLALAQALRQDFGERVEPVLLFRSNTHDNTENVAALLLALWEAGAADGVVVHAFAIDKNSDPEGCLEPVLLSASDDAGRLAMALAEARMPAECVDTSRAVLQPEDALFSNVLLNAVAHRLTEVEIPALIVSQGFAAMPAALANAVRDELDSYGLQGLTPALPLTSIRLRALAEAVMSWKFARKIVSGE